ncbi:MAG: HAD-IA family hydrolase [Phascolarctobacterium sp.]|nr:HAD-IA family hydrolase [Phascolarctobacterium sp.]
MKYKLAIFDMDGTILDTLVDLANAVNHALAEKNLPQRSLMEIRSYLGNGMLNLIRLSAPKGASDAEISELKDIFTNYYKAHCAENTKPYDGILELIAELRAQGVKTAVVSNKPDFGVQLLVEEHFPTSFDFAVGEKEGIAKKPAPDSVNAVLEKLNIARNDAVYIGDSEVDYATAKNAEMDDIIVTWGFRDEDYLQSLGAKTIVHTMEELKAALN